MKSNHASCTITLASKERIKQWATTEITSTLTDWGQYPDSDTQQFSTIDDKGVSSSKANETSQETDSTNNAYSFSSRQKNQSVDLASTNIQSKSNTNLFGFGCGKDHGDLLDFVDSANRLPKFFQQKNAVGYITSQISRNKHLIGGWSHVEKNVNTIDSDLSSVFRYGLSPIQQVALIFTPLNPPDGDYMIHTSGALLSPFSSSSSVAFGSTQNTAKFPPKKPTTKSKSYLKAQVPNESTTPQFLKKHLNTLYLLEAQELSLPNSNFVCNNSESHEYESMCVYLCSCFPVAVQGRRANLSIERSIRDRIRKNIEKIPYYKNSVGVEGSYGFKKVSSKDSKTEEIGAGAPNKEKSKTLTTYTRYSNNDRRNETVKQFTEFNYRQIQLNAFKVGLSGINKVSLVHSSPQYFQKENGYYRRSIPTRQH
jgi:hypothetical protein